MLVFCGGFNIVFSFGFNVVFNYIIHIREIHSN